MADQPLDRESIEERNDSLRDGLELRKRENELAAEQLSLSNTLVDTLQEELGIRRRRTTEEENLLSVNKKINKDILNQKLGVKDIASLTKQKLKNDKSINVAKQVALSLESKLQTLSASGNEDAEHELKIANEFGEKLNEQAANQAEIIRLTKELNSASDDQVASIANQINALEEKNYELDREADIAFNALDSDGKRLAITKAQEFTLEKINEKREEELKTAEKIEQTLGVTGKLANLIGSVPGLGKFTQDALAAVRDEQNALADSGDELMDQHGTIKSLAKNMGKGISESLADPLTLGIALFREIFKSVGEIDGRVTGLQKQLGLGRVASSGISRDFHQIANTSSDTFITTSKLAESFGEMSSQLGFVVDYSGQTLETFTTLNKRLGLSVEQATSLTSLLKLQGDNTEDQLDNLTQQIGAFNTLNGTAFDTKQVLGDIANTSAAIQVSFAGSTDELASSVLEAKKLGLNLSQVDKIADSLLQFESSIENELKAELLLGKEINLEKARQLALNNDLEGVAKELQEQQLGFFEYSKLNRIQQTAMAEAMGMGREEMSAMLLQQQRMTMTNDEISSQLEGQELSNFKQLTAQESLNAALEKMRDIFSIIAEGPMGVLVGGMASILSNARIMTPIMAGLVTFMSAMAAKSAYTLVKSTGTAIAEIFRGNAKFGPIGIASSIGGVAALVAALAQAGSAAQSVQDGIAPAGKGPFTITDAYGATAITAKGDGVAVSPNITRGGESASTRKMEMLLERLVMKDSNVYMDSDKVGSAFAKSASF